MMIPENTRQEPASETSVERALRVLDVFTLNRLELGVAELAEFTDLPRSTVHRLVSALNRKGYLEQDPVTKKYRVGLRTFAVGTLAVCQRGLGLLVQPDLVALSEGCHETVNVGVLVDGDVMYVNKVKSREETLESDLEIGQRVPGPCTALGKVLLANLPSDELDRILAPRSPLPKYTSNTITDVVVLKQYLDQVREQGFALDDEEFRIGIRCIAAPITGQAGQVVAALSIAAPSSRLSLDILLDYKTPLLHAAERISNRLVIVGKA